MIDILMLAVLAVGVLMLIKRKFKITKNKEINGNVAKYLGLYYILTTAVYYFVVFTGFGFKTVIELFTFLVGLTVALLIVTVVVIMIYGKSTIIDGTSNGK